MAGGLLQMQSLTTVKLPVGIIVAILLTRSAWINLAGIVENERDAGLIQHPFFELILNEIHG
jgi:hypothetical protein